MSAMFNKVITYGFCSNMIFIVFQVYKISAQQRAKQEGRQATFVLFEVLVTLMWLVQFWMLIVQRFSHPGKVCAGDYYEDYLISEFNDEGPVYV